MDVGGPRKGFEVAVVDERALRAGPVRLGTRGEVGEVVDWLLEHRPRVVAVDSPRHPACNGRKSRDGEVRLVKEKVCGIRYTPDAVTLNSRGDGYYAWILNGLCLYDALGLARRRGRWRVVECFPTASFTRWDKRRGLATRAAWSRRALESLGLDCLPPRMNQDGRDAVAAAVTARLWDEEATEAFGDIHVPTRRPAKPRSVHRGKIGGAQNLAPYIPESES